MVVVVLRTCCSADIANFAAVRQRIIFVVVTVQSKYSVSKKKE